MKISRFSVAAVSVSLLLSGCGSVGIGYSGEVISAYGNDRGSDRFTKQGNRLGCGTVTSLRNVNQTPLYDKQYELQFNGSGSTRDLAGLSAQLGIVGMAAAVIGSVATDTAIEATRTAKKEIKLVNVPQNRGLVKAVQLTLDSGDIINLPLVDVNKFEFSGHYKVGKRYKVYYSPTYENLQLVESDEDEMKRTPEQAARIWKWFCSPQLDKARIDELLSAHGNKVDESKIY